MIAQILMNQILMYVMNILLLCITVLYAVYVVYQDAFIVCIYWQPRKICTTLHEMISPIISASHVFKPMHLVSIIE